MLGTVSGVNVNAHQVTGDGMRDRVLTDSWLKRMQERDMVPRFKEKEFALGLVEGMIRIGESCYR